MSAVQRMGLRRCLRLCLLGQAGAFRAPPFATRRLPPSRRWSSASSLAAKAPEADVNVGGSMKRKYSDISSSNVDKGDGAGEYPEPEPDSAEAFDPVCRVVATSDGKISRLSATSSLSPSSRSLLEKVELLYSVQSQKELRDLTYVLPRSAEESAGQEEVSFDTMEDTEGGAVNGVPRQMATGGAEQEERLVSVMKESLENGGFKLLEERDLDLCSALNAGYLLRLSLLPDVRELDPCIGREFYPELYQQVDDGVHRLKGSGADEAKKLLFDGRVLIFRRGYSKEITTGRLLLPKLDYLQASLVQRSSTGVTRKLGALEQRLENFVLDIISQLTRAVQRVHQRLLQQLRGFTIDLLEIFGLSKNEFVASLISKSALIESNTTTGEEVISQSNAQSSASTNVRGNRIFKLGRYRTSTSIIPDALDLDDALAPFLLCEVGANRTNTVERDIYDGMDMGNILCQYDDVTMSDFKPEAVRLLERIGIQNTVDFLSKKGRRELIKNYFRSSTLVEPAYEEVIVIWRPLRKKKPKPIQPPKWLYQVAEVFDMEDQLPERNDTQYETEESPMPLEIKAFYDVPMANIQAVLPKTRLVFRPADAIVFDLVSVVSFLAVAGSLKFDSPKLDLIALVSLAFFAVRTFFRYSNKYARYDLLVNKFLTSKISHRGPGALKYIVSEANTNKALRAMLIRDWLSSEAPSSAAKDGLLDDDILQKGKSYVNDKSTIGVSQIDVDVLSALEDLKQLGLIDQDAVKDEQEAMDNLKQQWNDSLG